MKRARRVQATPMITITSMMDMFTIILVFLLNFLDPTQSLPQGVTLPASRSAEVVEGAVSVLVSPEGIRVGDVDVMPLVEGRSGQRLDALYDALVARRAEKDGETGTLLIQCDKGVPFSVLGDVLYTAGQAGFPQFRFVVVSDAGSRTKAP